MVTTKDKYSFVMADLPGLIEGAHLGKGLGLQFLRHIERCRVIVHIVDMSNNGRNPYEDFKIVNKEISDYRMNLSKRPMIIVASKMDEEGAKEKLKEFKKHIKKPVIEISALTDQGIEELLFKCEELLKETPMFELYDEENVEVDYKLYTLKEEEKEFEIVKEKAHIFRIIGDKIIKFYRMTNISTDEGMMILLTRIRKLKIDDELEKMGAEDGDLVYLDDFEFQYVR